MLKFVRFSIVTNMDRNAAILEVREVIYRSGGWVEDQVFFSNKATNIRFEMSGEALGKFQSNLHVRKFTPHVEGALPIGQDRDVKGSVSLTFVHQEPDLRREIPPFG